MRNTDEQLAEILDRSGKISKRRNILKHIVTDAVAVVLCIIALAGTGLYIPDIANMPSGTAETQYGSFILSGQYTGYVVVGIIAFVLGIFVTLLCLHVKETKDNDRR